MPARRIAVAKQRDNRQSQRRTYVHCPAITDPACWHPWQVNYQVLQPASREVNALSSSEVYDAFAHTITQ